MIPHDAAENFLQKYAGPLAENMLLFLHDVRQADKSKRDKWSILDRQFFVSLTRESRRAHSSFGHPEDLNRGGTVLAFQS